MASNRPLQGDITVTGYDQHSIATWMANVTDLINEMQTDHATNKTSIDELITLTTELRVDHATNKTTVDGLVTLTTELRDDHATFITAITNIGTTVANYKTIYDAHTHTADGNASRTSLPDTGSPTGSPSAASAFTTTAGSAPATITATAASAGYATITAAAATASAASLANSTAITLLRA